MSRAFTGNKALGNLAPETRSALLRIGRSLRSVANSQTRLLANEDAVTRQPGVQQQRGYSSGGRTAPLTFGLLVDRPTSDFLLKRGTGAMLYVATDSGLYWWSGTVWTGPL